jgi:RimJ/RimL family protein N-acetyltransferase
MDAGPPPIVLIPVTTRLAELLDAPAAFTAEYGATLGAVASAVRSMVDVTLRFHERTNPPAEYGGYLAADARTMEVVGGCGFNCTAIDAGDVEIAYGTFPPFEGRGYAKAMARALTVHALGSGAPRIIAHTMPEHNASGSILRATGFRNVGTVIADPEDGPVWRWELPPDVAAHYER